MPEINARTSLIVAAVRSNERQDLSSWKETQTPMQDGWRGDS